MYLLEPKTVAFPPKCYATSVTVWDKKSSSVARILKEPAQIIPVSL